MRKARSIREEAGLSLMDVSRATSIHLTHLGKFERGLSNLSDDKKRELTVLYSAKLSRAVTVDDLLTEGAGVA